MSDSTPSLRDDMLQMVNGYELSRAIHVAAVLGVADFLMDGRGPSTTWQPRRERTYLPSIDYCARWPVSEYLWKTPQGGSD